MNELKIIAVDRYNNFRTNQEEKDRIAHWLRSVRIKLLSSINSADEIKQGFITSTNSWKVIEAVWAVNNRPVPPSSSVMMLKKELSIVPCSDWFERLFYGNEKSKTDTMIRIIEWVLPRLEARVE